MLRSLSGRPAELCLLIERFLKERCDGKLDKLPLDDPKREALLAQFEFSAWLEDAARRAGQIQAVTHALKATHPYARGTSLYRSPEELPQHDLVGSHNLDAAFARDVVGNAAALDVYQLLKLVHEGQTLLDLVLANDADLHTALSADPVQATRWMGALASITQPRAGPPASHALAKQLYWLVGDEPLDDEHYQLLAPVYASSLAHKVFQTINDHRFGEPAKAARQAKRAKEFSEQSIHDYLHLAVQKLGGSNQQNVSPLNSQRGGNNYLLASLPPQWVSPDVRPLLKADDVFPIFGRREAVRPLVNALRLFLKTSPGKTMETRNNRDDFTDQIIDELLQFASLMQQTLEPGWSALPTLRARGR